ncbi:MAG: hypothetical protein LBH81_03440 [Rickettsiales bacterium]|jgi:hypothetical protein|nr:hypothetical protein [Rickettsiales bacterium]
MKIKTLCARRDRLEHALKTTREAITHMHLEKLHNRENKRWERDRELLYAMEEGYMAELKKVNNDIKAAETDSLINNGVPPVAAGVKSGLIRHMRAALFRMVK